MDYPVALRLAVFAGGSMPRVRSAMRVVVVVAVMGAFITRPVQAQNTGVIEGTITDDQGGVMPGATVTLKNTDTGVERSTTSDAEGKYRFPALQPGRYSVLSSLQGFASAEIRDIVLTIGLDVRYDMRLKVQAVEETVTVTAESPLVDVTKSEVAGIVTQQQIETL